MRILYIDTSSSYLYLGIVENSKLIDCVKKDFGHDLSRVTLPKMEELFKNNSIEPKSIDKIIVVNGPGSFTGIRIRITNTKIYAWSLNIDITTISSIEAMMLSNKLETNIVPIIDARRGFVYCGIYNKDKNEIMRPRYMKYTDLKEELNKLEDYTYISNDEIEFDKECIKYDPDIEKIVSFYQDREAINPHIVNPEYLKLTEAEEKNKKNV